MSLEHIHQKPLYTDSPMTLALDEDAMGDDEGRAMFKGVAITTGYNKRHYRFSLPSIRSLASQAKKSEEQNGAPLYVMHSTFWDLPIGRTLSGMIRKKSGLYITAYIKRNVPNPDTNSIIDRIADDTIDSLSLGWDLTDKSYFQCDICNEKMDKGYFMPYDSNMHYPGKKIMDGENKGKIVTATVFGPIRFRELSIVGIGADPRAKILQDTEVQDALREEFNALSINPHDIPVISELSGWDAGMFSESLSFFDMKPQGAKHMAAPEETTQTPSEAAGEWKVLYEQAQVRITELEDQQDGMVTLDDHQAKITSLREQLDAEVQARQLAESESKENDYYAKVGLVAAKLHQDRAVRAFKSYKGNNVNNPVDKAKLKKLQESTDLEWLQKEADEYWELADEHKNTRADEEKRVPRQHREVLKGVEANI